MANKHYTSLETGSAAFSKMLGRFGVVTVMDAYVFDYDETKIKNKNAYAIYNALKAEITKYDGKQESEVLCKLDTLKVANVSVEGPTKTVTGGKYANTLIKYGKTARLEMQDALGNAEAVEALCGGLVEYGDVETAGRDPEKRIGLHIGSDFSGAKTIVGKSFFIDQESGKQVDVIIMFYQFNPDSIFNLTQDAEGDATVFDMNGDLLTTDIMVGNSALTETEHGVFYSVIDPAHADE